MEVVEDFLNSYTLPETNIAPENGWLEYYFPIGEAIFWGAMLVSGRVYIYILYIFWKVVKVAHL